MNIVTGILYESYVLFKAMAPYLLFGFFVAGILHAFFEASTIVRHLGKNDLMSVVKASLFGIPLPLCSCGVIPAAMMLRREGASRGAVLSFLISTPTTGVDSFFATYSLLGPFFAVYRIIASFFAGIFSGILANICAKEEKVSPDVAKTECRFCCETERHAHSVKERVKIIFTYAFGELIEDVGKWLVAGIFVGGAISFLVPTELLRSYAGHGWEAMIVMLIIGIPMYVCATGSIPIAAALLMKGMNPGAAFVFLVAGPATNAVGMTVIGETLGKRTLYIYLFSISFCSLLFGWLLDKLWGMLGIEISNQVMLHHNIIPNWLTVMSSVILLLLILFNMLIKPMFRRAE